MDVFMLLFVVACTSAMPMRGHYIVDYQRLPLYQEFYLSPGVYRPLFPSRQDGPVPQSRSLEPEVQETTDGQEKTEDSHQEQEVEASEEQEVAVKEEHHRGEQHAVQSLPVLKYSNSMTPDGSYAYKYETADGMMREESSVMEPGSDGELTPSVKGSYSYPGPDGRTIRVDYVADEHGFRAVGDHIPSSLTNNIYNFKYVVP